MKAFSKFIGAASLLALSAGFAYAANDNTDSTTDNAAEQCIDIQFTARYNLAGTTGNDRLLKSRHNDLFLSETWREIEAMRIQSPRMEHIDRLCLMLDTDNITDEQDANTLYMTETNEIPFWKSLAREYVAFGQATFVNLNKQGEYGFAPGQPEYEGALKATRIEALTLAFSTTLEMQMRNLQGNNSFTEMTSDPMVAQAINTYSEISTGVAEVLRILETAKNNGETALSWADLRNRFDYAGTRLNPRSVPLTSEGFYNVGGSIFGKEPENTIAIDPTQRPRRHSI